MQETRSHNVCLDRLQKASKHCSTLLVQRLGVSLPFRQAFGQLINQFVLIIMH